MNSLFFLKIFFLLFAWMKRKEKASYSSNIEGDGLKSKIWIWIVWIGIVFFKRFTHFVHFIHSCIMYNGGHHVNYLMNFFIYFMLVVGCWDCYCSLLLFLSAIIFVRRSMSFEDVLLCLFFSFYIGFKFGRWLLECRFQVQCEHDSFWGAFRSMMEGYCKKWQVRLGLLVLLAMCIGLLTNSVSEIDTILFECWWRGFKGLFLVLVDLWRGWWLIRIK
jgi:hypothetical protein